MSTKVFQKIGNALYKNSPTILTGLGVTGLFSTIVMAVTATPKALTLIRQEEDALLDGCTDTDVAKIELTPKEIIQLTYKCYIPTAIMGALTIGCMIGANSINLRRNAALASLYSLSESTLKEYQAKVVETIGKNKEKQIKDEVLKEKIEKNPLSNGEVILTGRGNTLCYEAISGRYFRSDIEHIRKAINELNRNMLSDMFIPLNEVYYALDLKSTKMGNNIGWHVDDGLFEPSFSSQLSENGEPCLVLDFDVEPRYDFRD